MRDLFYIIDQGYRADFIVEDASGFTVPAILALAFGEGLKNGTPLVDTLRSMAANGIPWANGAETAAITEKTGWGGEADGYEKQLAQSWFFDFDNGYMGVKHNPSLGLPVAADGVRCIPDAVMQQAEDLRRLCAYREEQVDAPEPTQEMGHTMG